MSLHFKAFVQLGKEIAAAQLLTWDIALDATGSAVRGDEWNITALAGGVTPKLYLRHFGSEPAALAVLNEIRLSSALPMRQPVILSQSWQNLIKATVLEQVFMRRNSPGHVANNVVRPLRVLATCVGETEPWDISIDDISTAMEVGGRLQASGKLRDLIVGLVKVVFDGNHLSDRGPLSPALSFQRIKPRQSQRASYLKSQSEIRESLEDRKSSERLPERRAFWELVRIVMTEQPLSFMDELRFAAIRTMILTGFRIGEATSLPADWRTERHYYDAGGKSADRLGGFSKALMIRHFAEKQRSKAAKSSALIEKTHYVPAIFEEIVSDTLSRAEAITAPMRRTLRKQTELGRAFPSFEPSDLVRVTQIYPHLTGNSFWLDLPDDLRRKWIARCRKDYSSDRFDEIQLTQMQMLAQRDAKPSAAIEVFFRRLAGDRNHPLVLRNSTGECISFRAGRDLHSVYVRIEDVENYVRTVTTSKLPDTEYFELVDRSFASWEFLFLHPKRSLSEERNGGLCDVTRYFSVGRPDQSLVGMYLGDQKSNETLFTRYGESDEDRSLTLTSHSLRHLQNTELFRLGIADTIISKRFNRRSVAQSYEYDHRSLAEDLDQLELPVDVEASLGDKASTVARLIQAGRATGPIVDSFKRIQREEGDVAAFEFLKVEADGFHATPYGHCLNSFTVDPCPKHLECFSGCRHLSATDLPENRSHLRSLEVKLIAAIELAEGRPSNSVGRTNQIDHAKVRLDGVRTLLNTPSGEKPFPDGPDLSLPRRNGVIDEY